jgi:hypothetical protein
MRRTVSCLACLMSLMVAGSLRAQEATQTTEQFGEEFGQLVGSEGPCELTFKPDRVADLIRQNVAPDDLKFSETFGLYSRTMARTVERMTGTERLVHCTTVERNARALGLIN